MLASRDKVTVQIVRGLVKEGSMVREYQEVMNDICLSGTSMDGAYFQKLASKSFKN